MVNVAELEEGDDFSEFSKRFPPGFDTGGGAHFEKASLRTDEDAAIALKVEIQLHPLTDHK